MNHNVNIRVLHPDGSASETKRENSRATLTLYFVAKNHSESVVDDNPDQNLSEIFQQENAVKKLNVKLTMVERINVNKRKTNSRIMLTKKQKTKHPVPDQNLKRIRFLLEDQADLFNAYHEDPKPDEIKELIEKLKKLHIAIIKLTRDEN